MLINFVLVQFVPGGGGTTVWLEQDTDAFAGIAGGGGESDRPARKTAISGRRAFPDL